MQCTYTCQVPKIIYTVELFRCKLSPELWAWFWITLRGRGLKVREARRVDCHHVDPASSCLWCSRWANGACKRLSILSVSSPALLSAVQAQLQCPSLIAAAQSSVSPSCSAHSDCRGLVCANSNLGWNVTLTVQPCTDPVVVDVSVLTTANGNTVSFDFTQVGQQQQQQGNIAINLLRYRNASHIFVQVRNSW